jgi:hypothetical protein
MGQITSREELKAWFGDKPTDFAQVIAARAALRVLPYAFAKGVRQKWVKDFASPLFRSIAISWAARNFPAHDMVAAAHAADAAAFAAHAAHAAYAAADAAAFAAHAAHAAYAAADAAAYAAVWANLSHDCNWLTSAGDPASASRRLTREPLWPAGEPKGWSEAWVSATGRLAALNEGYSVWVDWYDRRIKGERAAFDIPGDSGRKEDKALLARLADATGDDFWDKGAAHVNTTLQSWIDEARERVAPKAIPPQESDALNYGINNAGKLDRLPATDQQHLRDAPDQQRIYRDVREAALELQGEGQRLGARLERALGRFLVSLPENFTDAECYSIWRDGNTLRRIHLAHRAVAGGTDYDDKRLDAAMAEMLGDVLDRYNLFAFGDDGLRAKDEAAIPPQERAKAEDEAEKAAPLIDALLNALEIMTDIVRDDIVADQADQALPKGDPYDDQALVQSNKSMRNRIAALLGWVGRHVKQSAKNVREGAERAVGALIVSDAVGVTNVHDPVFTFAATHFAELKTFAETAYASSLQWLWDALSKFSDKL